MGRRSGFSHCCGCLKCAMKTEPCLHNSKVQSSLTLSAFIAVEAFTEKKILFSRLSPGIFL